MYIKDVIAQAEDRFEKQFKVVSDMTKSGFAIHADFDLIKSLIFSTYTKDLLQSVVESEKSKKQEFDEFWGSEMRQFLPKDIETSNTLKKRFNSILFSSSLSDIISKLK